MVAIVRLVFAVFILIFRGYIVRDMWDWFVMTQFPHMPAITLAGAIGLSAIVGLLGVSFTDFDEKDEKNQWIRRMVMYMIAMLIMWGQAYIIHLFM